jgi:hypothetical protein
LDETGSIAHDRFFGVGCLKLREPSRLLRDLQKLRDRHHWYAEFHWVAMTRDLLPMYREVIDLVAQATQLLIGSIPPGELVSVVADNYSTPAHVVFEQDVRAEVNRRLAGLVVTSVCRMDSKAADPLQVVDLLTAAVAFEFRQAAGLAGSRSPKAVVAAYLRFRYNVKSFLKGYRSPGGQLSQLNVKIYTHRRVPGGSESVPPPVPMGRGVS